jgi:hypothetical protein
VEYPACNTGLVELLRRSLPNQGKKELMILVGINPTEWDLPK